MFFCFFYGFCVWLGCRCFWYVGGVPLLLLLVVVLLRLLLLLLLLLLSLLFCCRCGGVGVHVRACRRVWACGKCVCVCVASGGVVVWLGMFGVAVLCWRGVVWRGVARLDGCRAVCACMVGAM